MKHSTFLGELRSKQAVLASRHHPEATDPAYKTLRSALDFLHASGEGGVQGPPHPDGS